MSFEDLDVWKRSARLSAPVPEGLESFFLDCLCKDPARRPAGAREVCERLDATTGFGAWTAEDARRWWEKHRTALATTAEDVEHSGVTLTRARESPPA